MKYQDLMVYNSLVQSVLRYGRDAMMDTAVRIKDHDLAAKMVYTVTQRDVGVMFDRWVYDHELGVVVDGKTYGEYLKTRKGAAHEEGGGDNR